MFYSTLKLFWSIPAWYWLGMFYCLVLWCRENSFRGNTTYKTDQTLIEKNRLFSWHVRLELCRCAAQGDTMKRSAIIWAVWRHLKPWVWLQTNPDCHRLGKYWQYSHRDHLREFLDWKSKSINRQKHLSKWSRWAYVL